MSTRTRFAAATALATLAAGAFALPAVADDTRPPIPEPVDAQARTELCERIPAALERIEARIATVEADGDTAGSLEWLGRRVGRAEDKGREKAAGMLADRAEHRAEHQAERRVNRLERLQENMSRLEAAQAAYCTAP